MKKIVFFLKRKNFSPLCYRLHVNVKRPSSYIIVGAQNGFLDPAGWTRKKKIF